MEKPQLKYWYEWGADSPLWPACEGAQAIVAYPADLEKIGLSNDLIDAIKQTAKWHDTNMNWQFPQAPHLWTQEECDRFSNISRKLYDAIVAEIGDRFEVLYDEPQYQEDPQLQDYLRNPDQYLQPLYEDAKTIRAGYEKRLKSITQKAIWKSRNGKWDVTIRGELKDHAGNVQTKLRRLPLVHEIRAWISNNDILREAHHININHMSIAEIANSTILLDNEEWQEGNSIFRESGAGAYYTLWLEIDLQPIHRRRWWQILHF